MSGPGPLHTAETASGPVVRFLPGSGRAGVAVMFGTALAVFLAQVVAIMTWVPPVQVSTVWLPGGVMLAVALLTEPRRWPAVMTAAATPIPLLFLGARMGSVHEAVVFGLLYCIQAVAVAAALRALLGRPPALGTVRAFVTYLAVAVVGGSLLASGLFVGVNRGLGYTPTFALWRTFALAAALSYLTMTPTVVQLVAGAEDIRRALRRRWVEAGILALLLLLANGLVFSGIVNPALTWAGLAVTLSPLLLWSTTRFGTLGASASLLLVAVIATFSTARGLGPFASQSPADNTLAVQLFILGTGVPLLGLGIVISQQRRTSAALQSSHTALERLSGQLIAAREEEATRIARELHDDVGQRLALVSIGLSRLRQASAETAPGRLPDIVRLQEQMGSVAHTLRQISHQLHPSGLEQIGLAGSLELMCEEVRRATGLELRVANNHDTSAIPLDVAMCLYRVAQEALSNVVRHSQAHSVDVSLRREGADLVLQLTDDGQGMGASGQGPGTGLGLRSAAERVRLVGGALAVRSAPGQGTTVCVAVPVKEA